MEKYKCVICGCRFFTHEMSMYHVSKYKDHVIIEKSILRRLRECIKVVNWLLMFRLIGYFMVFLIIALGLSLIFV